MKPIDHERQEIVCPDCDSLDVRLSYEKQTFEYGVGAEPVMLSAIVPMYRCGECGYALVGPQGADIEHEVICRHLGLLSPADIKAIRVKLGFSQAALAGLTGIGVASIARWESGHLIQNRSYDNLLRMLVYPENIERLQTRFASGQVSMPTRVTKIVPRALPIERLGKLKSSQVRFSLRTG
jgi:putative zinc finger/helix-turn-helix YgiT family protein